jgi:hypothetical protein
VSDSNLFWFHCGRCGSLFQSTAGEPEGRLCPNCGEDPVTGIPNVPTHAATATEDSAGVSNSPEKPGGRSKRKVRKGNHRHLMLKLLLGWSLLLVLIVLGARRMWPSAPPDSPSDTASSAAAAPAMTGDDVVLFQNAGPKCGEAFVQFLAAGTPEMRNQFVLSPVTTASRMAQFYSLNPIPNIDPATLRASASGLLDLPGGGKAFEAHWESDDGKVIDAVFRQENDEWRLDWEHFSRYSDYPWPLFLAGTGPDEGEFRLLARERLAEERKGEETISLVLYAPRFSMPAEVGSQSPEFLVSRSQRDGQLLDAAFKLARSGGKVFGSKLPNLDPEDMIRVRVKVRRTENEEGRAFEITSVIACHWLSLDEPGVEVPEEASGPAVDAPMEN